jgi:hypothetical protein
VTQFVNSGANSARCLAGGDGNLNAVALAVAPAA